MDAQLVITAKDGTKVYGELSRREPRRYVATKANPYTWLNHPQSLRSIYQAAKRQR